jgi:hypothetical protein
MEKRGNMRMLGHKEGGRKTEGKRGKGRKEMKRK